MPVQSQVPRARTVLVAVLLALPMLPAVAHADWLVMADGARIETLGPWRLEGRRVVFTTAQGTLSALRVAEIDLEASRAATEAANQPAAPEAPPPPPAPKPKPVLVLTNKDVPKAAPEEAGDAGAPAEAGQAAKAQTLRVLDWSVENEGTGLMLTGRVENGTKSLQNDISVLVEVRDEEGEVLASAVGLMQRQSLVAGGTTYFRARFPDLVELPGQPHFEIKSSTLAVGLTKPDSSDEGETSDEGEANEGEGNEEGG